MRILHVINRYWPAPGGAERHLQAYAERQAAAGNDVTVFTTDAFDLEYFWNPAKRSIERRSDWHNGVRIERFAIAHLPPGTLGFRAARRLLGEVDRLSGVGIPGLNALLPRVARWTPPIPGLAMAFETASGRYDIVHGMNIALEVLLLPALDFARASGVPFLVSPLTHLGESERSVVRRYYTMRHQIELLRQADAVFVQTPTEARYLAGRGVQPDRMVLAGAGVDLDEVRDGDGAAFRTRQGIGGPIVAALGAMAYDKGTCHLVEAMEQLWAAGSRATLVLAGPVLDQFASFLAARPGQTRQQVRVLGSVSEAEKWDLLAAADVFALPSRTDSFGIVFLEAWLAGLPVVAADAGGVPDVVEHERSGLVVPFGDVAALAGAIGRLLADPDLSAQLAATGAAQTRACYTWDHVYERVRPAFERPNRAPR